MIYTLENEFLTVKISDLGAEMKSVVAKADGCEYLWQGDPTYWRGTAPWMFPICSNLFEGKYTYCGKEYAMPQHGFARNQVFVPEVVGDTAATFALYPNAQTREIYPFEFALFVKYELKGRVLTCELLVQNKGDAVMYATLGGHPGFNVPLGGSGEYTDYYLEFSEPCSPDYVVFTEEFCDSGKRLPYPLEGSTKLPLSHDLFRVDGVFLSGTSGAVTLKSDVDAHSVTVTYGDAPYVGFWSSQNEGPYVCVEPWWGMASQDGVLPIEEKCPMFRLLPGAEKQVEISIAFA
ncbi:MAG: aldose 1-epimerase family protein [Clostridia bacterium]|nr:aldose 1-epimerase family protein [Clostridia bacterium]